MAQHGILAEGLKLDFLASLVNSSHTLVQKSKRLRCLLQRNSKSYFGVPLPRGPTLNSGPVRHKVSIIKAAGNRNGIRGSIDESDDLNVD